MKKAFSLVFLFCLSLAGMAQTRVVAHRGYWRTAGSAQNSITSLQKAAEIGCWGSEFDVWMTSDGVPIVFHDATIGKIRLEDTPYSELMNHRLDNGEFIPTLQQYLSEAEKNPHIQLILEIKPHKTPEREAKIARMCVDLVKMMGLENRTEYISFSPYLCQRLHEYTPLSKIAYLNGDLTPAEVKEMGLTGIDYHHGVYEKHPEWLKEASRIGVEVNVWTVDGEEALRHHAQLKGIDIITTNDPELLQSILNN